MSRAWARPATCAGAGRLSEAARLPARWLPVLALVACLGECRVAVTGAAAAAAPQGGSGETGQLQLSRLKHSNLGGYGPDAGEPVLRFGGAATGASGQQADLVVVADPDFRPDNASGSAIVGGIARVSLRANSREVLTFKFVTGASGAAVPLDALVLTLLLTDPRERVKVAADPKSGLTSFCMTGTTLLSPVVQQDPAAIVLVPTAALSGRGDAGAEWTRRAKDSRDTAITLQYRGVSEVVLEVQVVGSAGGGVDFQFSGAGPVGDSCVDWLGGAARRPARPTVPNHMREPQDWGAVLTDAVPVTSCDIACEVDGGVPYTCRQRIRWDSGAKFGGEANACELAHRSVLEECEPCSRCSVQDSCRPPAVAAVAGAANASRGLVVPYRCDGGDGEEERAWAPAKTQWCCAQYGRGCAGDSAPGAGRFVPSAHTTPVTVTRTQTATQTWTTSTVTTVTKTKSSTTTTKTTTTSTSTSTTTTTSTTSTSTTTTTTTPELFDCLVGFALWVQDWSPAQKRYCCRRHHLGCSTTLTSTSTKTSTTTTTSTSTESSTSTTSTSSSSTTSSTNTSTATRTRSTTSTRTLTQTRTRTRTGTTTRTSSTKTTSRTTSTSKGPTRTQTRTITTTRTATATYTGTTTRTGTATRTSSTGTSTTRTGTSTTATRTSVTWTSTVTSRTRTSTTHTTLTATSTTGTDTTSTRTTSTETTTTATATATTTTATTTTATTTAPWDCTSGISSWQLTWSEIKRDWCCKHKEVGCAATSLTTTGTTLAVFADTQFDCSMGLAFWQVGWSASKKEWCCAAHGVGCPEDWSPPPQAAPAAPEASPIMPSDGFDCIAGFAHWRTVWSAEKKAWCCQYKTLGCDDASLPVAPVPLPDDLADGGAAAGGASLQGGGDVYEMQRQSQTYDCVGDLSNWHQAWSYEQKEWCCQHAQLGCYDCSGAVVGWPPDKLEFCCKSVGTGCDPGEAEPASQGPSFGGWGALGPMLAYSLGGPAGGDRPPPAGVAARLLGGGGGFLLLFLALGAATLLLWRRLWEPRRDGAAQLYAHVGANDMYDAHAA